MVVVGNTRQCLLGFMEAVEYDDSCKPGTLPKLCIVYSGMCCFCLVSLVDIASSEKILDGFKS